MLQWASFCLGNTILTLRIVALYNRHKMIVRLAYSLLVLNWLMTLVFSVHTLYLFSLDIDYAPVLHLCVSNAHSPTASVIFIGPAVFEFILFLLTLYRALQDMKNRFFGANIHAPFLFILYRDGLYYFAAIFAVHLWNSLAYSLLPSTGIFMGVYFAWSVMTTMSSRVYLNLVLAAHGRGENALTTGDLSTVPAPQKHCIGTAERGSRQSDTFGGDNVHNGFTLTTFSTSVRNVPSSPSSLPDRNLCSPTLVCVTIFAFSGSKWRQSPARSVSQLKSGIISSHTL
ncbi:hypothetical protein FRC14_004292 [Serendipita sp. 396]|nr:hypothetical protein FRC14_004292 [Serendipita sp. 396]